MQKRLKAALNISINSLMVFQLIVGMAPDALAQQKQSDLSIIDPSSGKKLDKMIQDNRKKNQWASDLLNGKSALIPADKNSPKPRNWPQIGQNILKVKGPINIDPKDDLAWDYFLTLMEDGKVDPSRIDFHNFKVGKSRVTREAYNVLDAIQNPHGKFIGQGYLNLMLGMGASDAFFALTSADPKVMAEWYHNMTSPEFHINMGIFNLAMEASSWGLSTAAKKYLYHSGAYFKETAILPITEDLINKVPAPGFKVGYEAYGYDEDLIRIMQGRADAASYLGSLGLSTLVLPLGDLISSYFSNIYNHPKMRAYFATYDEHTPVTDPKTGKLTLDPKIKSIVRAHMKMHMLSDIISDNWNSKTNFQLSWHMLQLAAVQVVYQGVQQMIFAPLEVRTSKGKVALVYRGSQRFADIVRGASQEREIYAIKSVNVAKWFEAIESTSSGVKAGVAGLSQLPVIGGGIEFIAGAFGGLPGLAGFFLMDHVVSDVVFPARDTTIALLEIEKANASAQEAMDWFTDQNRINRAEVLPWSLLPEKSYSRNWLKFFADGANMRSKFFTDNISGWHHSPDDPLGSFWEEAFSFMSEFSNKYLGKDIDSHDFYACRDEGWLGPTLPSNSICQSQWYYSHVGPFVDDLKNFKAQDYVAARLREFAGKFSDYRNQIILGAATKTYQSWSKNIGDILDDETRKEHYFTWIGRGMYTDDPYFIMNEDFWHPDPADKKWYKLGMGETTLDKELKQRVAEYDREVLGMETCSGNPIGKGEGNISALDSGTCDPVSVHRLNMSAYLEKNRFYFNKNNLFAMAGDSYMVPPPQLTAVQQHDQDERTQSAKKIISNSFRKVDPNPDLKDFTIKTTTDTTMQASQDSFAKVKHQINWLLSGMDYNSDEFKKNEGNWHDTKDIDLWTGVTIGHIFGYSLLKEGAGNGNPDSCFSDAQAVATVPCRDFIGYIYDVEKILKGGDPRTITYGHLDQMVAVALTFTKLREIQANFVIKMAGKNNYYRHLIHGDLLANPVMRSLSQFIPFSWQKGQDLFHKGGKDNMHFRDIFTGDEHNSCGDFHCAGIDQNSDSPNSLPAGAINNYNYEMGIFLNKLQVILGKAQFSKDEPDHEMVGFTFSPMYIMSQLNNMSEVFDEVAYENRGQKIPQIANKKNLKNSVEIGTQLSLLFSLMERDQEAIDRKKNVNSGAQALHISAQAIYGRFKDSGEQFWPEYIDALPSDTVKNAFSSYYGKKLEIFNKIPGIVDGVVGNLAGRGTNAATGNQEDELRNILSPENFGIPLMAATVGSQDQQLILAGILVSQILDLENEKIRHARLGCFLLDDTLCSKKN